MMVTGITTLHMDHLGTARTRFEGKVSNSFLHVNRL